MSLTTLMLISAAIVLFVAMLGLLVLGYRQGKSRASESREGLGAVEGAVFALLGLMLAFQFGGAANRLGDRRDLAIQEANAIGTAYLRLDLLPADDAAPMRELFRRYIEARIQTIELKLDAEKALAANRTAMQIQQEIWSEAITIFSRLADRSAERLLLPALNDMIDLATERNAVGNTHAAVSVQIFLVALAMVGAFLAGQSISRMSPPPTLHMVLFAAVISATIYCILDMEYPRLGFIRIGVADQPLYDLLQSLKPPSS